MMCPVPAPVGITKMDNFAWAMLLGVFLIGLVALFLAHRRVLWQKEQAEAEKREGDSMEAEYASEAWQQLRQRIGELEQQVKNMQVVLDEESLNVVSLKTAEAIEDLFIEHRGGRTQRLAHLQIMIRETIRMATTGQHAWNAWNPSSLFRISKQG